MNRGGRSELEAWPHVGVGPLCGGVSPVAEAWPRNMTPPIGCATRALSLETLRRRTRACVPVRLCLSRRRATEEMAAAAVRGGWGAGGAVLTCLVERVMLGH